MKQQKLRASMLLMELMFLLIVVGGSVLLYNMFAPAYYRHQKSRLEKLQQQYPVVTANFYQGTDGTFQQWSNEKQSGILNDYAILQYNNLVDKKHRIKNFFADISEKALE